MRLIPIALLALITVAAPAAAEDLSLLCAGNGTYPQASTSTATVVNPSAGYPTTATGTTTRTVSVAAEARFELRGESARIFMPPQMTPSINGGSDGGWWTFDRLEVTPEAISGRFSLNMFNKPEVRIDRMTGTIQVDGNFRYYFLGQCERIETPLAPRF
jgi:hypothetical protein